MAGASLFDDDENSLRRLTHVRLLRDVPTLNGDLKAGEVFRVTSIAIATAGVSCRGLSCGDPSCLEVISEEEARAAGFDVELGKVTPKPRRLVTNTVNEAPVKRVDTVALLAAPLVAECKPLPVAASPLDDLEIDL